MPHVTPEEVRHVAALAQIALSEQEIAQFQPQLDRILEYIEQLRALDTERVEPTSHVLPLTNVLREDTPRPCLAPDTVVGIAPARQGHFIKVPRIIEQ